MILLRLLSLALASSLSRSSWLFLCLLIALGRSFWHSASVKLCIVNVISSWQWLRVVLGKAITAPLAADKGGFPAKLSSLYGKGGWGERGGGMGNPYIPLQKWLRSRKPRTWSLIKSSIQHRQGDKPENTERLILIKDILNSNQQLGAYLKIELS